MTATDASPEGEDTDRETPIEEAVAVLEDATPLLDVSTDALLLVDLRRRNAYLDLSDEAKQLLAAELRRRGIDVGGWNRGGGSP